MSKQWMIYGAYGYSGQLIAEEAVLSRRQWGVELYRELDKDGLPRFAYRWLSLNNQNNWQPAAPSEMDQQFYFSSTLGVVLEVDGIEKTIGPKKPFVAATIDDNGLVQNNNTLKPDIYLYSSGETSAFRLQLIDQDEPERNQWISSDVLGRFNVEQAGANDSSE